jgi:hypothetical protein
MVDFSVARWMWSWREFILCTAKWFKLSLGSGIGSGRGELLSEGGDLSHSARCKRGLWSLVISVMLVGLKLLTRWLFCAWLKTDCMLHSCQLLIASRRTMVVQASGSKYSGCWLFHVHRCSYLFFWECVFFLPFQVLMFPPTPSLFCRLALHPACSWSLSLREAVAG